MRAPGLLVLFLVAWVGERPAAAADFEPLPLTGEIRIAKCTRYPCPRPAEDDPRWRGPFALGLKGIAPSPDLGEGLAWASLRFSLPPGPRPARLALFITHPADAEEVLLNGVPAGGKGLIRPRYATAVLGPRALPLPPGALHDGVNEILLLSLFSGRNPRFLTGPLAIGEQERLEARAARLLQPIIAMEAAFLSMLLVVLVFYGFLVVRRVIRSDDHLLFMAFIACSAADILLGSHFLHGGEVVRPGFVHAQALVASVRTLVMLGLVTHAAGSRFGPVSRLFAVGGAGFVAADLLLPPLTVLTMLDLPRKSFLGLLGLYYLFVSARAVRQRREDAVPVLAGVALYVVGSRLNLYWGIAVRDYAVGAFALCMLFALTSRHARLRARLEEISARLLDAHEVERRRIARDIHDGVGQSLLALRLKLKQFGAGAAKGVAPQREQLETLATDTGSILEEVRRLSLDLRPSFVESMSLKELLHWYGSSFAAAHGLALHVSDGEGGAPDPGPRIKDNVYRIYQEALTNIAKHAGASKVEVSLQEDGPSLVLEVADDGRGLEGTDGAGGIGLETMRERAELVGGTCRFESVPNRGTKVRVEVPVR